MDKFQIGTEAVHTDELLFRDTQVSFSRQQSFTPHQQYQLCDAYSLVCRFQ
jgi:hypothetical protein